MVFDAASAAAPIEIDPVPFVPTVYPVFPLPQRLGSAIGGNTLAYTDFGIELNGELIIHDLATSASVRITNDTVPDVRPAVSPDGAVVTWGHCPGNTQCDIWQAVKTGPGWSLGIVADSVDHEGNPDTNGALVVFEVRRGNSSYVFWRPVAGGAEVQLQLPGFEWNLNPRIAGNFIAFASSRTGLDPTDLYVYDLVANKLYQITDTPAVTERYSDITVLADGSVRVVWSSEESNESAPFLSGDVKGATFSLQAIDNESPVFTPPANIIVNATMPAGALVNYPVPVATDNIGVTSLVCTPASGSVFPIGTSSVQCTAGDAAGNTAGSIFTVRVKGAPEQIVDLMEFAKGMALPPLLKTKLLAALQTALANPRNKPLACGALSLFIQFVQAQPANVIPPAKKAQMIADATRIKAVLGCS